MPDLSTTYLGLKLATPLVASASPLTHDLDNVRSLEDNGAAAIVFHSVFEESAASRDGRPALDSYGNLVRRAKESVDVPLIGSVAAACLNAWLQYAQEIEQAGVNALELNLYQVPSRAETCGSELEDGYVQVVEAVKSAVRIPVAIKLTPFFTSLSHMARRFDQAGADGFVLFNRFYQPDINLDSLKIEPTVLLSTSQTLRLPLTWIGMLYGRISKSLAGSGGVHAAEDAVKLLLAGADVTMMCSALLRKGISQLRIVENGLRDWMDQHEYKSIAEMKGNLSQIRCPDPSAFERTQYMNAVRGVQKVVVSGREAWRILAGE